MTLLLVSPVPPKNVHIRAESWTIAYSENLELERQMEDSGHCQPGDFRHRQRHPCAVYCPADARLHGSVASLFDRGCSVCEYTLAIRGRCVAGWENLNLR